MYRSDDAEFANVFTCPEANAKLEVRDVIQETELTLTSELFPEVSSSVAEAESEEEEEEEEASDRKVKVCGQYLFYVVHTVVNEVVIFGQKEGPSCAEG